MNQKSKKVCLLAAFVAVVTLSGCATYRTDSNINPTPTSALSSNANVLILEGVPDRKYKELEPIEVSVKKLTIFNTDPTREQANKALVERARIIGADAVINVTYKSGVGLTTWGYIDAKGTGVKLDDAPSLMPKVEATSKPFVASPSPNTPPIQSEGAADRLRELNKLYKDGVIDKNDFEIKKRKILESM